MNPMENVDGCGRTVGRDRRGVFWQAKWYLLRKLKRAFKHPVEEEN
jgi:hypothetical protein